MKNRNLNHRDDWMTPSYLYEHLNEEFQFDFDPCPFMHDTSEWDGLEIEWSLRNYINPPYSKELKDAFVKKAIEEKQKGKLSVLLLPVSTSTVLFHDYIYPNIQNKELGEDIRFFRRRIPFIGVNTKGQYVNWHLTDMEAPEGVEHVRNSGMHDSMLIIFKL